MSDLISRSELLKAMNTWDKFGCDCHSGLVRIDNINNEEYVPFVHYEDMVKCVNDMPTAYDIDKVVEELEKESYQEWCDSPKVAELKDAIEIVRQGGVSDDVCEWEYVDAYSYYKVGCKENIVPIQYGDYCPYCGKKIKVVE